MIKKEIDENKMTKLDIEDNNNEYKISVIYNNVVYTRKLKLDHLLKLYNLIFSKDYLKEKNI